LFKFTAERKDYVTTRVAKVDTMLSPRPGVTPEGHCQPGTSPIPRTSQTVQRLARLSILILSKAYPSLGILKPVTRLMKVL
jgi:hypothetical protein